jgi:alkaline phosphatase D
MSFSRRSFIKGLGGSACALSSKPLLSRNRSARSLDDISTMRVFEHGVASGDPLYDRVVIWTRVSSQRKHEPVSVYWQVAFDTEFTQIAAQGGYETSARQDFTVKIDVQLPKADTTYFYRFKALGADSMIGRTRTSPEPWGKEPSRCRIAVCSCSSIWSGYMNAYDRIADRDDIDLVIHCGDYVYDVADRQERVLMPLDLIDAQSPNSLEEIRRRYAYYRKNKALRRAHQQHPFSIIWDNHEIEIKGDRAFARQAFHEWTPTRSPEPDNPDLIYRRLSFGSLVDIFLLDTRFIGRNTPITGTTDKSLLGESQYQWLTQGLKTSETRWRLLGNQVLMSKFQIGSRPLSFETWDGYPQERARLFKFLSDHAIDNTIVVTGDAHMSFANHLKLNDKHVGVEFLPSSVSRGNLDEEIRGFFYQIIGPTFEKIIKSFNNDTVYLESTQNGYGIVDITPERAVFEFWHTPIDEITTAQRFAMSLSTETKTQRFIKTPNRLPTSGKKKQMAPEEPLLKVFTQSYGGTSGQYVNDCHRINLDTSLQSVALQSSARLEGIRFTLNDGSNLVCGRSPSATAPTMSLFEDEWIDRIILCESETKNLKKRYISYIKIKTNKGQIIEAGTPSSKVHFIDAPANWQLIAPFGRSSRIINQLGFIAVPVTASLDYQ